ncbi:hypothetical protein CKO15_11440 [Halorhodospira abdelmalekii]|uniref:YajG family lipoprotein n=1 Tax=Halorhodospira abdelmalekii TaxID=421629 RepID=UPI00190581DD|nr:YajG family lipoprotein [Halorhodospira abdelmalekii]MBK1735880.1 hypothetical protein [Halorhodospira abdelmalekii]
MVPLLLLGATFAVGCAPPAHDVRLRPAVEAAVEAGADAPGFETQPEVALRVVDRRAHHILGYRHREQGVALGTENDLVAAVQEGLRGALEQQGVEVIPWHGEAEQRLTIGINAFEYERSGGWFSHRVTIQSDWEVRGVFNGERLDTEVIEELSGWTPWRPSRRRDARMVNELLERAIDAVANHPELSQRLQESEQ